MPLPLSQGYAYTLTSPYGPPPMIGQGIPPSMIPAGEWNMGPPPPPQVHVRSQLNMYM